MILVTGSTGNVGSEVVKQLATAGHKVRAFVQDESTAKRRFPTTVDLAKGDLGDRASLDAAMRGVEKVYLLAPFTTNLVLHERTAIEAARRAGVKHIVKHSVLGAQYEGITLGKWHRAGEKQIEASGMVWTFVRPSGFFTNTLAWAQQIKTTGTVYYPTGNGKLGMVDPRDVAAVAVKTLTEPGHEARSYDVTGPEALSAHEQCEIIGRTLGKPVKFSDVPDQAARDAMLGQGMQTQLIDVLIEFTGLVRGGNASLVTDTVQKLTGKSPRTFEAWVRENAPAFRG